MKLLVMTEGKEVEVNFIVVNDFLPYIAIMGWPWIHVMEAVPSKLHQKIKFLFENGGGSNVRQPESSKTVPSSYHKPRDQAKGLG